MKQYQDLIRNCIENGSYKAPAREGQCGTYEIFGHQMRFDMADGFPAVTTKKLFFRGVVEELLWMLNGRTNVIELASKGVNIWNKDAYNFYKRIAVNPLLSEEDFNAIIGTVNTQLASHKYQVMYKTGESKLLGDLGSVYGKQLRSYGEKGVDQLKIVIEELKANPNSRRAVVTNWNPEDFWDEEGMTAALPACHAMWQVLISDGRLHLHIYQRSADLFLGVPFNIASYALLLHILSAILEQTPGELVWTGGSIHLYEEHLPAAKKLLENEPLPLPELWIKDNPTLQNFRDASNYKLLNYQSHDSIKADLIAGN